MANKRIKLDPMIKILPDEIMLKIISLLPTIDESARVSIICKHWYALWKYVQTHDFYMTLDYNRPQFNPGRYLTQSKLHFPCFKFLSKKKLKERFPPRDPLFEKAISSFPLLQELRLICCPHVYNFTINSKTLKTLEIRQCKNLRSLTLIAPELVSYTYMGSRDPHIEFDNVPKLVQLTFVDYICKISAENEFCQFQQILHQILKLGIVLEHNWITECSQPPVNYFLVLREIRVDVRVYDTQYTPFLLGILLKSFSEVESVSFNLFWPKGHYATERGAKEFEKPVAPYHEIREFELDGYRNGFEVEFFRILVSMAKLLKKVVVRVSRRDSVESDVDLMGAFERSIAMARARQDIKPILPPDTEFVLL